MLGVFLGVIINVVGVVFGVYLSLLLILNFFRVFDHSHYERFAPDAQHDPKGRSRESRISKCRNELTVREGAERSKKLYSGSVFRVEECKLN